MLGKPRPPMSGLPPGRTIQSLLKLCQVRLPGPGESAQCLWTNSKEAPSGKMWPPGAWLSREYLCQEEKGPLSLERYSPARTQGLVRGGLLNWARWCSTDPQPCKTALKHPSTSAPEHPLLVGHLWEGAPGEQDSVLWHDWTSDPPGETWDQPPSSHWKAGDLAKPYHSRDGVHFPCTSAHPLLWPHSFCWPIPRIDALRHIFKHKQANT